MSYNYKHLVLAFMEFCGDNHGARFIDEDITTLEILGKPADKDLIAAIEARAQQIAQKDSQ